MSTTKDKLNKPKISLAEPDILSAISYIREYGDIKYFPGAWHDVNPFDALDAFGRHTIELLKNPHSLDEESGFPHLWHAACNIAHMIAVWNPLFLENESVKDAIRKLSEYKKGPKDERN